MIASSELLLGLAGIGAGVGEIGIGVRVPWQNTDLRATRARVRRWITAPPEDTTLGAEEDDVEPSPVPQARREKTASPAAVPCLEDGVTERDECLPEPAPDKQSTGG